MSTTMYGAWLIGSILGLALFIRLAIRFFAVGVCLLICIALLFPKSAKAQIPTTDIATQIQLGMQTFQQYAQYIETLNQWYQQLEGMQQQLQQAQALYSSVTGQRGYGALVSNLQSQQTGGYLPPQYDDAVKIAQAARGFIGLYQYTQGLRREISVLTDKSFRGKNDPNYLRWLMLVDQLAAQKGINRKVYDHGQVRMARIQGLADKITTTQDQKAIQELQAAMTAESLALQADQIKVGALQQMFGVEERILRQQQSDAIVQMADEQIPRVKFINR